MKRLLPLLFFLFSLPVMADTITLPSSLKQIKSQAFTSISSDEVIIPPSVTSIADDAFDNASFTRVRVTRGSYAETWVKSHSLPGTIITEGYALPKNLSLSDEGTVSFQVEETYPHTIMLGVYKQDELVASEVDDLVASGMDTLLAILPIDITSPTTYTTNISSFFDETASYYVSAKAVENASAYGAREMDTVVSSNIIYFQRPEVSLSKPENISWEDRKSVV